MIKVTYLDHSGFFLEFSSCCLLFDYYRGDIPVIKEKPLYVFVSHAHHDHYQKSIFSLRANYRNVTYVLSDDIHDQVDAPCLFVHENCEYTLENLHIMTLKSTDEGVAFLVQVENHTIYHAGDLHWWHWEEENTPRENEEAKQAYLQELQKIKSIPIDLAFVVVDPRQESQFSYGIIAFLENCEAKVIFPMHMWGDYQILKELKKLPQLAPYCDKIMDIHHTKEEFIV